MKLYIKQAVFSWNDKFTVRDESERDRYSVEGEIFTLGKKLHIYNSRGNEVAYIRQKLLTFMPQYYIEADGQSFEIVKEFTFFNQRFYINGLPWTLEGDFFAHEYAMLGENNREIMRMSKHWFTWGDSYELDIHYPPDELMCLCAALAVDCMLDQQRN